MTTRIGVDVGGTFTDFVAVDSADRLVAWKTPTRPDPSQGIFGGMREMQAAGLLDVSDIAEITVGTTIALNAILSGSGARTGLLTTAGFRDVLEIGRANRAKLYDLQQEKLPVLVRRADRLEVDERLDWRGSVLRPLRLDEVRERIAALREREVESLAVCFLHSYANPEHEQQVKQLVLAEFPDLAVSVSHEVLNHYREFERTLLTVLNAYVKPVMQRYLDGFRAGMAALDARAALFIAHSGGGVMAPSVAGERAIQSALSGPAAGVLGARHVCSLAGIHNFITMDMGGTSCDVAVIDEGRAAMTRRAEIAGYRVALRSIDVGSISAGGGTVAWVDDGGLLRVGPQSAGSTPGPACYGRGGSAPTITDAHVVLGHIDPDSRFGGSMRLDGEAALRAIEEQVARPLSMTAVAAAAGILTIADAAMVRAIEVVSVERGHDPREFDLVAFGGAAPLHASAIANELGIARVVVPCQAGVLCALGTLCCDEQYEVSRMVLQPTTAVDPLRLGAVFGALVGEAHALVGGARVENARTALSLDVRYIGQTFSLELPLSAPPKDGQDLRTLHQDFERRYAHAFGYTIPGNASEIENARVVVTVPRRAPLPSRVDRSASAEPARRPWRAHFPQSGLVDCVIVDATDLAVDDVVEGPAIINTTGSTSLVGLGRVARLDEFGNLVMAAREGGIAP